MARRTLSDVIEKWARHNGGDSMYDNAVEGLLYDLDLAGFAIVRKVTADDLVADDG